MKVVLAVLALSVVEVARAGDTSLAALLPPGTPLYAEMRPPTPEEAAGLALTRAMRDPDARRALERITAGGGNWTKMGWPVGDGRLEIEQDLSSATGAWELRWTDAEGELSVYLDGTVAAAWVGLREGPSLDAAVMLRADPVPQAIEIVKRALASGIPGAHADEVEHRGLRYTRLALGPATPCLAEVGGMLVATVDEARMRDVLDRSLDTTRDSLATDGRHREALAQGRGAGSTTAAVVFHPDRALAAAEGLWPAPVATLREQMGAFGVDGIRSLLYAIRVDGEGLTTTLSVLVGEAPEGVASLFAPGEAAKLEVLDFAPAGTLYATAGRFAPAALFRSLGHEVTFPAKFFFFNVTGVDLESQILDRIGPEAAVIVSMNRGLFPDIGIVCESPDPEALLKTLEQILGRLPPGDRPKIEDATLAGVRARVVLLDALGDSRIPVAPTYGVVDGCFLLAPFPMSFQRFVLCKRGESPRLAEASEDFRRLRARVPEGALGLSYLDFRRAHGLYYDTLMPLIQSMDGFEQRLYDIPPADAFDKHFYGRIAWRVADEHGMHWVSHAPMNTGALLAAAVGTALGFTVTVQEDEPPETTIEIEPGAVPADSAAPSETERDPEAWRCRANVRLLRARLRQYGRSGSLPAGLDSLSGVEPSTLLVPGAEGGRYRYYGPDGEGSILIAGMPNGVDGRITVLTTDMQLRRVTEEELTSLLEGAK